MSGLAVVLRNFLLIMMIRRSSFLLLSTVSFIFIIVIRSQWKVQVMVLATLRMFVSVYILLAVCGEATAGIAGKYIFFHSTESRLDIEMLSLSLPFCERGYPPKQPVTWSFDIFLYVQPGYTVELTVTCLVIKSLWHPFNEKESMFKK